MPTTLDGRLSAIRARIGWRITTLTDTHGRVVDLDSEVLLDAALRVANGHPPGLPSRVSRFLAEARMSEGVHGALLVNLRDACRRMWRNELKKERRRR